jgi:ribosomal protein L15
VRGVAGGADRAGHVVGAGSVRHEGHAGCAGQAGMHRASRAGRAARDREAAPCLRAPAVGRRILREVVL